MFANSRWLMKLCSSCIEVLFIFQKKTGVQVHANKNWPMLRATSVSVNGSPCTHCSLHLAQSPPSPCFSVCPPACPGVQSKPQLRLFMAIHVCICFLPLLSPKQLLPQRCALSSSIFRLFLWTIGHSGDAGCCTGLRSSHVQCGSK